MAIHDSLGHLVEGHTAPLTRVCSPEQVEVMAVLLAVRFVHGHGFQPMVIESDSLQAVQACNSSSPNLSVLER